MSIRSGSAATLVHTVTRQDIEDFARVSEDHHPNHVDDEYMGRTSYGRVIAHGILLMGFMSAASSRMLLDAADDTPGTVVSYGYDRVRFVAPVFVGDEVTVDYEVVELDADTGKGRSNVTVKNQVGDTVAVATHLIKVVS